MITYIPHLEGYFQQRLEIMKISLGSLLVNTPRPFDLFVFDNGSCPEAVRYLQELRDQGEIDFLLLSKLNIGKIGAFQVLFHAMTGEVIAYSDDDILFYPGWLEAQLKLLEAFPEAGMISALPVRNAATYAIEAVHSILHRADSRIVLEEQHLIPDEWEDDWAASTGRDPQAHRKGMAERKDLILQRDGARAVAGANHFQFIAPRDVLMKVLPNGWSGKLMGQMVELDEAVDRMGRMRIATPERYTRHIGNMVSAEMQAEARRIGLEVQKRPLPVRKRSILVQIPGLRRLLSWLYDRLFRILNEVE